MKTVCLKLIRWLQLFKDLPPLFFRWVLAFGFFVAAMHKINYFDAVVLWFTTLGIPYAKFSVSLCLSTELCGAVCLFLGILTRLISIPLMIVMGVAIKTVHWTHGFSSVTNGIEVPLYYLLMLFSLLILGPGRVSVDAWIYRRWHLK